MNHELLMIITAHMPMRVIPIDGKPYLERYFISQEPDGTQHWLHHYLTADSEHHLHSHPWYAESTILCGWYVQEELVEGAKKIKRFGVGMQNFIAPETIHRIVDVDQDTWTYLKVLPERLSEWFFIEEDTNEKRVMIKSGGLDWFNNPNIGIRESRPFGEIVIKEKPGGAYDIEVGHLKARSLSRDEATGLAASLIFQSPLTPPYLKPNKTRIEQ